MQPGISFAIHSFKDKSQKGTLFCTTVSENLFVAINGAVVPTNAKKTNWIQFSLLVFTGG